MAGSIMKKVAVAAIMATGAVAAPAVASAEVWSVGGAPYSGAAQLRGSLTATLAATGTTTTCNVTQKVDLDNGAPGGVAQGQLKSTQYSGCATSAPGCTVSFVPFTPPPGPITTSGRNATLSGIAYIITYGGGGTCAWNGQALSFSGSMTASVASGTNLLAFNNSPGLTTPLSVATTNGTLSAYAENAAGGIDLTKPITLQP